MATDLIFQKQTMSSLEIAQLIGKQHAHVMRDIRSILEQGVAESNFGLGSYSDANGQNRPCYNLTKKGCLILASGYDAKLREKIIDRWEFEKKVADLIDEGFITNFDNLLAYLRRTYHKASTPNVFYQLR